jgi:hypothetical protein
MSRKVGNPPIKDLKDVLIQFKAGRVSIDDAERMLKGEMMKEIEQVANLDLFREARTGIPEIVFAESKSVQDLETIINHFLDGKGFAIISRLTAEQIDAIKASFPDTLDLKERARMAVIRGKDCPCPPPGAGVVGIITAGTSDIPIAEEAATMCELMGCQVERFNDVGIAGIHRVFPPMKAMIDRDVDVIIVCAGMEGALPAVVASLTDRLVIGVPISTGYGFGGKGETALRSMLQSCAPGLVTVNIDNGIGAGAAAALVARRIGKLRESIGQ